VLCLTDRRRLATVIKTQRIQRLYFTVNSVKCTKRSDNTEERNENEVDRSIDDVVNVPNGLIRGLGL
jgi:uncharacterized protein YggL (DUF469 family)